LADIRLGTHGGGVGSSDDQNSQVPAQVVTEIVRYLASRPGIGPGSRILLCGVSNASLIRGLTDLGLLVTCTNDDCAEAETLQQIIPQADWCEGNVPREQFENSDAGFNLVVMPAPSMADHASIFSRHRLMELAGRMACIHPGGFLIQLGGSDPLDGAGMTHSVKCCLRQMSAFPGRNAVRSFGNQIRLRYTRQNGQFAASLHIPDQRLSPFEWDVLALNASKRLPVDCCQNLASCGGVAEEERAA
jgi:hypothetical protein